MNGDFKVYSLNNLDKIPSMLWSFKQLLDHAIEYCTDSLEYTVNLFSTVESEFKKDSAANAFNNLNYILTGLNKLKAIWISQSPDLINEIVSDLESVAEETNEILSGMSGVEKTLAHSKAIVTLCSKLNEIQRGIKLNLPDWFETVDSGEWGF